MGSGGQHRNRRAELHRRPKAGDDVLPQRNARQDGAL